MPEMVLECPHCHASKIGFDYAGEQRLVKNLAVKSAYRGEEGPIWLTFWVCRNCQDGVVVKLTSWKGFAHPSNISPRDCIGDPRNNSYKTLGMYPKSEKIEAPEHVPAVIAQDYKEAMDSLQRQNWTSAGMMFRKVLFLTTVTLANGDTDVKKMRAIERIKALAKDQKISPAMKDWADIIRLEGNAANYEDKFDEASATQMKEFTELFLIYAFTLPARVKEARERYAPDTPDSP